MSGLYRGQCVNITRDLTKLTSTDTTERTSACFAASRSWHRWSRWLRVVLVVGETVAPSLEGQHVGRDGRPLRSWLPLPRFVQPTALVGVVSGAVAFVSGAVTLVAGAVAGVGDPVAHIGSALAGVSEMVPVVSGPVGSSAIWSRELAGVVADLGRSVHRCTRRGLAIGPCWRWSG